MSVDGMRRSMEIVELGSSEPSEDEEEWSGLRSSDLRYDPYASDDDSGKEDGVEEDDGIRETVLIDDDEEEEEEEERLSDFAAMQGNPSLHEEMKKEAKSSESDSNDGEGKAEKESYAMLAAAIFDRLPAPAKVIELVTQGVKESCTGRKSHLAPLADNLLRLACVHTFIRNWWVFLVKKAQANAVEPPTSTRAAMYTKERMDERQLARQHFILDDDIRSQASTLPVGRVDRDLTGVFLVIESVIDKTLTQSLHNVNFVKVTYPTFPSELDVHQKRIVYHLAGWLLSSALTRVNRDRRLGPAFLPFVVRHKYSSAEEFREAHPEEEFRGLEVVVEERNVKWEDKSLIFPSAPFFLFALAVEAGYRFSMENPALLATYHGDLGREILTVVSHAEPVKLAWARCVQMVPNEHGDGGVQQRGTDSFQALFEFVMLKWHNCRMFEYTRGLTTFRKEIKATKKSTAVRDDMSLRDQLKVVGGSSSRKAPAAGKKKKDAPPITDAHRARAVELAQMIGSSAWQSLTAVHLREYIGECGVTPPRSLKKADLQSLLRSLAPGIGLDANQEDEENAIDYGPELELGTGESFGDEKTD